MKFSTILSTCIAFILCVWFSTGCQGNDEGGETPLPSSMAGWRVDGEDLRYGPENLWEYINGAAEGFLAYEFEEVIVRNYRSDEGKELKVEVYRHGSPLMAFGIYSQLRGPGLEFIPIGAEGFADPYSLHFLKGDSYVKVAVFEEDGKLGAVMERFAGAVAERIPGTDEFPPEIACFPEEGIIEKSVTYITEGVLGSSKFPPSFIAEYRVGDGTGKLLLSPLADGERAREIFEWYTGTVGAEAAERTTRDVTFTAAVGNDRYRGEIAAFRYGSWIGVLTGFGEDVKGRDALMRSAVANIARFTADGRD